MLCSHIRNKLSGPKDGGIIFVRNFGTYATWCKQPEDYNLKKESVFVLKLGKK